jgi:hypothetical protein
MGFGGSGPVCAGKIKERFYENIIYEIFPIFQISQFIIDIRCYI